MQQLVGASERHTHRIACSGRCIVPVGTFFFHCKFDLLAYSVDVALGFVQQRLVDSESMTLWQLI